jgi:uncharacterized membrane protein YphA (DoxX/SURF4 family)
VQRLFSAFPDRGPGAGLLVLRVAAGTILVFQGALAHSTRGGATPELLLAWLTLAVGAMLIVGVLTPVAGLGAMLVSVLTASTWLPHPPADSVNSWTARLFFVVVSFAIALLGPGAFSLDAYLFGRREIVIPRQSPAD